MSAQRSMLYEYRTLVIFRLLVIFQFIFSQVYIAIHTGKLTQLQTRQVKSDQDTVQILHCCLCQLGSTSQGIVRMNTVVLISLSKDTLWKGNSWLLSQRLHLSLYWVNSLRAQFFISSSCRNLQYSSARASNSLPKISKEASFISTDCFSTWQAFSSDSSFSLKLRHGNRRLINTSEKQCAFPQLL